MRYALVNLETLAIVQFASNIDPSAQTKPPFKWLPAVEPVVPNYDTAVEVLEGPVYAVVDGEVVGTYGARAKTAGELDSAVDKKIAAVGAESLWLFERLEARLVVLEGQPSGGFFSWLRGIFGGS